MKLLDLHSVVNKVKASGSMSNREGAQSQKKLTSIKSMEEFKSPNVKKMGSPYRSPTFLKELEPVLTSSRRKLSGNLKSDHGSPTAIIKSP